MKFGIKCRVDSNTEIGKEPVQVTVDGMDFNLMPSDEGLLSELSVIVGVDNEKNFISTLTPSNEPEKATWALTVDVDQKLFDDLIDMVQYLEASLSFLLGVKKIYWEEPEHFFIPESEEESRRIDVTSFEVHKHYPPDQNVQLSAADFKTIVQQKSNQEHLKMIKLFHREGMREFSSFRYIHAYYNFYFVLEDLYGEGKTQNRDIEQKFKSSQVFRDIVQGLINDLVKGNLQNHLKSIQDFLREEKKSFDIDGIIELLVRVRGNLHHYSGKSTKRIGTPLNHFDFESMAYLLMGISLKSIIQAMFKK